MFELIRSIIDHVWNGTSSNTTEQSIIYYICGCIIVVLIAVTIDLVYRIFSHFWGK